MAKYVCVELVENTCQQWQEYSNSIDMLAITQEQANLICLCLILVFVSGFHFRAITNLILGRRY